MSGVRGLGCVRVAVDICNGHAPIPLRGVLAARAPPVVTAAERQAARFDVAVEHNRERVSVRGQKRNVEGIERA